MHALSMSLPLSIDEALKQRFGLESFRPWQREAIEAVLEGPKRVLVVAPTGGGKSLTYQLPAAMLGGTTLVVSPLVALMEDQVRALLARGISATYLASTLDMSERREREANLLRGKYELVYAAPERLASDSFVDLLARAKLSFVAIDEAHCIAQWGHDFRPDYLRIGALLERVKPERVLACTATATPSVRDEILKQLGFDKGPHHVVLRGFARPNLHLAAQNVGGPKDARAALLSTLKEALGSSSSPKGGAIVYAATRKATEEYAKLLAEKGWNAAGYHAGMDADTRTKVADEFAARKLDVVVATNAFGMGIDRSDIRTVVHVQPPSSIEAYYQEVGRAGRDGAEASGLLLCSGSDISLRRRLMSGNDDWALFRELLRYIDARSCRHDFVLRYFGDEHELLGGCGHCDVCVMLDEEGGLSAEDTEQTTIIVKKALSAVARAQKRGGLVAIAEMLHGDETEKTKKFGFTALSTFGLLRDRSLEWVVALLRALLAAGWIDLTQSEHPVPFLTRAGAGVMKGESAARIVLPAEPRKRREGRTRREPRAPEAPELDASARPLFERLRAHRAALAKERGVPAYVIAFDRTLVEMATHRPGSRGQLMGIYGMGPSRVESYGDGFLAVISQQS